MADIVDKETRSRMMSGIRGKDTKPELLVRRFLHRAGLRFRLHAKLPGKPDLVFPKHHTAVFVHGCFWHGHSCRAFRLPKTNTSFWKKKIESNQERDKNAIDNLKLSGWRSIVIWECELRGHTEKQRTTRLNRLARNISRSRK